MIEVMHHLRLIQRQILLRPALKHIAAQIPAVLFQLLSGAEQVGVVRHVEQSRELHPPRVAVGLVLVDEHGHAAVDELGQFGVDLGAEDRAGLGVRVHERDLVAREREAAALVGEILDFVGEEHELGWRRFRGGIRVGRGRAECEAGEFVTAMHAFENRCGILKIKQAHQRRPIDDVLEEELGGVVSGNAARNDATHATRRGHAVAHRLGEHGVEIHIATPAQRIATRFAHEGARSFGGADIVEELREQFGALIFEFLDHPAADGRVGGVGDFWHALREPLLLLQLHALPRRVAQNAVEAGH